MALVNGFNVNNTPVTLDADIIENMSANDVSYNNSFKYDENTVGSKLSKLESEANQQSIYDISAHNNGAVFDSLSSLLNNDNLSTLIPLEVRCGGMSIRFIQGTEPNSDNKYVQYRLMKEQWSIAERDWQQSVSYESLCSHVFTNDEISNKVIKELYLYKQDNTQINEPLYINLIGKNAPVSSYNYYLTIKNSNGDNITAWIIDTISSDIVEVKLTPRNDSGIYGKAILDFSKIDDGKYSGTDAVILNCAFDIKCSPCIYSEKNIAEEISRLENSVQDLSDELENNTGFVITDPYDITSDAIITYDKYLKNDGVTVVDGFTGFHIAELPLDEEVQIVSVTGTHFALGATLVFKDSNENIIGNVITVGSTQYGTITANKPQGATKAYTTYREQGDYDRPISFIVSKTLKETVKDKIVKAHILDYQSTEDKSIDIGLVQGSANTANGSIAENSSFGKTGKIDISHYDFIRIYNRFSDNICYTKWFNSNNEEVLPRGIGDGTSENKCKVFEKPEGATQVEISVIDWSEHIYIEFGKNNSTVTSDENGLLQQTDILSLPNVSMIPIFGQSLSVGAAAVPPISKQCKYQAGIMFATGIGAAQKEVSYFTEFAPLQEQNRGATIDSRGSGETVASGCLEQLIELLQKENGINAKSKFWNDHKFLFVTCGAGSTTIAMLMENYYQGLLNAVQGGKNVANNKGWTFDVPAVIYIQGETDQKPTNATPYATYKAALQNFATTFNTDVKQITGQKKDVKVIMYQTCSQNYWFTPTFANYAAMDIPTAQMDLINEEPNFCACNPAYMLDHSTVERIHLSAVGEKMMGLYCGISLKQLLVDNSKFKGLTLNNYAVSGNNITLVLNVPCPPLRIDTQFVKEVSNYGFKVVKSDNSDILSSVSVYDNQVILTCSESPVGCKLYYGFNGTAGYDGRKAGSRGNICDSGDCIYNGEIGGSKYSLRNYLYSFCISLT